MYTFNTVAQEHRWLIFVTQNKQTHWLVLDSFTFRKLPTPVLPISTFSGLLNICTNNTAPISAPLPTAHSQECPRGWVAGVTRPYLKRHGTLESTAYSNFSNILTSCVSTISFRATRFQIKFSFPHVMLLIKGNGRTSQIFMLHLKILTKRTLAKLEACTLSEP